MDTRAMGDPLYHSSGGERVVAACACVYVPGMCRAPNGARAGHGTAPSDWARGLAVVWRVSVAPPRPGRPGETQAVYVARAAAARIRSAPSRVESSSSWRLVPACLVSAARRGGAPPARRCVSVCPCTPARAGRRRHARRRPAAARPPGLGALIVSRVRGWTVERKST